MNNKKLCAFNVFITHFTLIVALLLIASCTQTYTPTKYSIEQFYQTVVDSDESGIFNVYEIDIISRTL